MRISFEKTTTCVLIERELELKVCRLHSVNLPLGGSKLSFFFSGLDASLLPLRQSDMCLVCIAFASWVLKTANPQVGDAWKAGMLIDTRDNIFLIYILKMYV